MPAIFYQPMGRRQFLGQAAKAAAALALLNGAKTRSAAEAPDEKPIHWALLSDTHVPADPKNEYRKFLPWENLKLTVQSVVEAAPEAVVLDGDAARLKGEVEDYRAIQELLGPLAAQAPIYIGMGNHDNRENFAKVFGPSSSASQTVTGKHVLVVERSAVRFVILDSLLYVNQVAGLLGQAQRKWLAKFLADSDERPTVLFVHHTLGAADGELLDVDRLFALLAPYQKVKAIIYGHSHEYNFSKRDGIHLVNIPAVGYNFRDSEPVGWVDALFTSKGAQLTLHAIGGNRADDGKTTSLAWSS